MKTNFSQLISIKILFWVILVLTVGIFGAVSFMQPLKPALPDNSLLLSLLIVTTTGSVVFLAYFFISALLAYSYIPASPDMAKELPSCTIIVPAYNEGKQVAETLYSLLETDYPAEKMEIIAINDGSKDETWEWIKTVAETSNGKIIPVNLTRNRGKKHALYCGIKASKSEIIITVDSDSIISRDALKNLVAPFVDQNIGGVAGSLRVKNIKAGLIPQMLDVAFVFGCDFIRRAQSVVGSVLCTPGALSAYRKSAILPYCDEWLQQKFLGVPSNIGEDRAITTILLRSGFRVVYQNKAVAHTCVPENYRQLCRMLIRWTRSDVRENYVLGKFAYRRNPLFSFSLLMLQVNLSMQIFSFILSLIFLPLWIITVLVSLGSIHYLLLMTLFVTCLWSAIPAVIYADTRPKIDLIWAFVFGVYSLFALLWIIPYSIFTVRNSKWLTRDTFAPNLGKPPIDIRFAQ